MCLARGGGVKGSVTSENGPKHTPWTRQCPAGGAYLHAPPAGHVRPACGLGYLIQASTLSLLASTHFLAAASSDSLSWAMYLATSFWSSFVQLKFFTRL